MFGFPSKASLNAVQILKSDHSKVKDLFELFEKTDDRKKKKKIVEATLEELKIHAAIEEEIFYPTFRKKVGADIMNEADEEHHVAKVLIAELEDMDGSESHYDAKFTVLAENVRHHIKEEESEMLPKTEETTVNMEALGEKMMKRKEQLLTKGVAKAGEDKMVAASRGKGDSPAKNASRRPPKRR